LPAQAGYYSLVCRVGTLLCALPAASVVETMRPLPLEKLPGVPGFVAGTSIIRGTPQPVIVLGRLLGAEASTPQRLVVVRTGARLAALAVDEVLGFRLLSGSVAAALPPLLSGAARSSVTELGALDGALLAVFDTSSLIPDGVFAVLDQGGAAA
jgi:purine-binding chemotaxis protein CheW